MQKSLCSALHNVYEIKGTIFQKAYIVNTYLFSKLWFTAQFIKLDEKILKQILAKALNFIYAGENERPIRALNFRNTSNGGMGLINPVIKARALLIKNMNKELRDLSGSIYDMDKIKGLYGHTNDFIKIAENGLSTSPSKEIYDFLILDITHRNTSLIPSRNEKRTVNVKWGTVWKNFQLRTDITS